MIDFTSALKLLEEKEAKTCLSTGCLDLDRLIGNGVEPGVSYLFYGDDQSGIDLFIHSSWQVSWVWKMDQVGSFI